MKPTRSILDPSFSYVSSFSTDLRATFARINRERSEQAEAARQRKTEYERKRDEHLREALASCATADPPPANVRKIK